jgi:hypothetical protein
VVAVELDEQVVHVACSTGLALCDIFESPLHQNVHYIVLARRGFAFGAEAHLATN